MKLCMTVWCLAMVCIWVFFLVMMQVFSKHAMGWLWFNLGTDVVWGAGFITIAILKA